MNSRACLDLDSYIAPLQPWQRDYVMWAIFVDRMMDAHVVLQNKEGLSPIKVVIKLSCKHNCTRCGGKATYAFGVARGDGKVECVASFCDVDWYGVIAHFEGTIPGSKTDSESVRLDEVPDIGCNSTGWISGTDK